MATLSLKQSGTKTLASASSSMTILRGTDTGFDSTVTAGSTILIVTYRAASGAGSATINWELTDGDTITVSRTSTTGDIVVYWTLLSFSSGVTVQHKSISLGVSSTTATVAVTAVTSGKAWIISGGVNHSSAGTPTRSWGKWEFDSTTLIRVTRQFQDGSDSAVYKCQVIDYDNCTVQTVTGSLSGSTATTDDKTITSVDTAKTALWGTMESNSATYILDHYWDAFLTSATNLRLERNGSGSITLSYVVYVVEFTGTESVQSNAVSHADATSTVNTTITAVTLAQSVAMMTGVCHRGMSSGRSATNVNSEQRHIVSSELTSTTNHQSVRSNNSGAQAYHSQVIQFAAASSTAGALGGLAGKGFLAGRGGLAGIGGGLAG